MSGQAPFMPLTVSDLSSREIWKQFIGFRTGRTAFAVTCGAALRVLKNLKIIMWRDAKNAEEKGKRSYQLQ